MQIPSSAQPARLIIEGWRALTHSYAVANQFQCLELLRRPGLRLLHREMPLFAPQWRRKWGLFDAASEAALRAIPAPGPGEIAQATLRMDFPHRLEPVRDSLTCVFMTSEFGCLPDHHMAGARPLARQHPDSDAVLVTPSRWSRNGLLNSGAVPSRTHVVPLGVDPGLFHPLLEPERAALRRRLGIDGFVFLNLGAMTGNKNIGMLLKAFAVIAARHPQARLLLKGNDGLYPSQQLLGETSQQLSAAEERLVWSRTSYAGQTVGFVQIAELYQAADAYVSPYVAEGFNLPVLEAAACGLPVICTAGGSTDDFTSAEFALRVSADVVPWAHGDFHGLQLAPSLESLVAQMHRAIEDSAFGDHARTAGPRFVANGFLWSRVVDQLLEVLFPKGYAPGPASASVPTQGAEREMQEIVRNEE